MSKGTILFADNDPDYLDSIVEFLEEEGYMVIRARNQSTARRKLEQRGAEIDLAIVDLRLDNDDDDKDQSGLSLARDVARSVPKIILTGFASWKFVRESMRTMEGSPGAVDFISKDEGPEVLLRAVHRALDGQMLFNPNHSALSIFIVHGRDEAREAVARLIGDLGLRPVILAEQPNMGRTIIEKLERYANAAYAVVLLTPDDVGRARDEKEDRPRARQNVILELGYFMARLGRGRVCALHKAELELPSDFEGVAYIPLDAGNAWKLALAKEFAAIGLPVNLNRILPGGGI